ncbi:hypothetical protein A9237_08005 [Vibrio owensii]|nr:hypothetical protein A9237_08005 [Vibrio owensii]
MCTSTLFVFWDSGFRIQDSGFRIQDSGFRIQDSGFRIQDSGFRIQDSGFRIHFNFVFLRTNSVNTYCTSTSFNSIPTNTSDFNSEALPRFKGKSPSS